MNLKEIVQDNYAKACIEVAEMIEPNVSFTDIEISRHTTLNGSAEVSVTITGTLSEDVIVIITRENENIKITYVQIGDTPTTLKERFVWYFAFNWKGIMACMK